MIDIFVLMCASNVGRRMLIMFLYICPVLGFSVPITSTPSFKTLSVENGLSNDIIGVIAEDSYGYIWIGTKRGLNRYDGYTITSFTNDPYDSLSIADGAITCLLADQLGNFWVGTEKGLFRFDYEHEQFISYPQQVQGQNIVRSLHVDDDNTLWIGTDWGLYKLDRENREFVSIFLTDGEKTINSINRDAYGNYFLGAWDKGFWIKSGISGEYLHNDISAIRNYSADGAYLVSDFHFDKNGILWIGTSEGIYTTKTGTDVAVISPRYLDFQKDLGVSNGLTNSKIHQISEDDDGRLWIGTQYGLNIYDPKSKKLINVLNNHSEPNSLSNNLITYIYKDSNGIMWIGTYQGGVNVYYPDYNRFKNHFPVVNDSEVQMKRYIKSIFEDDKGNLWIGSDYGLLKTSFDQQNSKYYTHDPHDIYSLNQGGVSAIHMDSKGRMWIGTWGGGVHEFDVRKEIFTRLPWKEGLRDHSFYQGDINIRAIHEDSEGFLWFGSIRGYLDKYDPETKTFEHFHLSHPESNINAEIIQITSDQLDNIWIGTITGGLYKYNKATQSFSQYLSRGYQGKDAKNILSSNDAYHIHFADEHTAWVATNNGLDYVNFHSGETQNYNVNNGLASNLVYNIQQDANGNLWLSTAKGISKFNLERKVFINYDANDGVRNNSEAGYSNAQGWIFFGGVNGINAFKPSNFKENENIPPVVFTGFSVNNHFIEPGMDPVLSRHINHQKSITLTHDQNLFAIEFAALNYIDPSKNKYMVMLEGFDKDWVYMGTKREARYTNLNPGTYYFRVKGSNNDGLWNEEERVLEIIILPPWWNTVWFKLLVLFGVFAVIASWTVFRTYRLKQHQKLLRKMVSERTHEIELQKIILKEQADKLHRADQMKIKFFTNISHEFRTPLTLILNPIDRLMKEFAHEEKYKLSFTVVKRNTLRLISLINQFLDISQIEAGVLKLTVAKGHLNEYILEILNAYRYATQQKNITYTINVPEHAPRCYFDGDKIEKILYNLLSNALKFTPYGKKIEVTVKFVELPQGEKPGFKNINTDSDNPNYVLLKVKDAGKGIPEKLTSKIFDRFFHMESDESHPSVSTGVGLSLTKDLIDIYRGKIKVKSKIDKGTEFSILLPVDKSLFSENEISCNTNIHDDVKSELIAIDEDYLDYDTAVKPPMEDISSHGSLLPTLLVVDDNRDVRQYLLEEFSEQYRTILAHDGEDGLAKALKYLPQVIISDVMMPRMNGYEFCEKIKSDMLTCHIPVILLTAKATNEDRVAGIELGADAYISKPFDIEVLHATISQLTDSREKLKQVFRQELILQTKEVTVVSSDEKLLNKIINVLDDKLSDSEFGVEDLGKEVGLSRTHLYRKIKELTGLTAIEFIRNIRLKRAAKLLHENKLYVSEVAYMCGFNELSYFRKIFKELFGVSPQKYASNSNGFSEDIPDLDDIINIKKPDADTK